MVKEKSISIKPIRIVLNDEITTIDHALTRPWTVTKKFRRERNASWFENDCTERQPPRRNRHGELFSSADGYLMPAKKGQAPPDLRYFSNR